MNYLLERNTSLTRAAMLMLAAVFVLLFAADRAGAATYVVDIVDDDGGLTACSAAADDCSLRGAINKADQDTTADIVTFSVANVVLESKLPKIEEKLTINGNGTKVSGTIAYLTSCNSTDYAFDLTGAAVSLNRLPIYNVCSRPIKSILPAPTIQIGPRRADNTVSINGTGGGANVDIYRADAPAQTSEALSYFDSVAAPGGAYSFPLASLPAANEKFTAAGTDTNGTTPFAIAASRPVDLTSPVLNNAVANANNSVRLDFSEGIGGNVTGMINAFGLKMGAANRQITSVDVSGNSVYLGSASTPWSTGEAGTVSFTGTSRVTDPTGNEVIGTPSRTVFSGPGELSVPVVSKFKTNPSKFCRKKTSKCRRGQTYLYITLNKPARVVFNVYRAKGRKFVVKYVRRLVAGTNKTRLSGTINGRTLPAASLVVNAVAEDSARNFSAPVDAAFKVVTKKSQL